jgi:predicted glycoside hydrolase/deacetylase ChbG (UPF0249 family)
MVFMEDSERAARLASDHGLQVGLHLNFSQPFTGNGPITQQLADSHRAVMRFLRCSKYALIFYHPFLRRQFRHVFEAQLSEFVRLYGRWPSHFDGHQHMHLCSNVLIDRILPAGQKVRRSFSSLPGEKSFLNRAYRRLVDRSLARRHCLTDYFFCLGDCLRRHMLREVALIYQTAGVELMAHPERRAQYDFLMSDAFEHYFGWKYCTEL